MRLRWRFSLKWLLLALTVAAATMGLFAVDLQRDHRHRMAIDELQRFGVRVRLADDHVETRWDWLKSLIGHEAPKQVKLVVWSGGSARSEESEGSRQDQMRRTADCLERIRHPQSAGLLLWNLDGGDLEAIGQCRALSRYDMLSLKLKDQNGYAPELLRPYGGCTVRNLTLDGLRFTDRALAELGDLEHLLYAEIRGTSITDKGIARLLGLPNLRYVVISAARDQTTLTAAPWTNSHGCPPLEQLSLKSIDFRSNDLQALGRFQRLEVLSLEHCQLDAETLATLPVLPKLKKLNLLGNPDLPTVPDEILRRLPEIRTLDIGYCEIDAVAIHHIREQFPQLGIDGLESRAAPWTEFRSNR